VEPSKEPRKPGLWAVVSSVLAAFFGVQNRANRERDFKHGRAGVFIAVGLAMTVLFVLTIVLAVKLVLRNAGP
jgi:hypothetical protein